MIWLLLLVVVIVIVFLLLLLSLYYELAISSLFSWKPKLNSKNRCLSCHLASDYTILLYIELTISFLIGRKRTVNFRNQRMWHHSCRLYNNHVKVTGNHVKVTGNHVVYDRGAWFLRVIVSSLLALFCLPSVKKHKHEFFFVSFNV